MMKRFTALRVLVLAILALTLCVGAAGAADTVFFTPHAEKLVAAGDKLYGLYSSVAGTYANYNYLASEIIEFDKDLNRIRSVKLEDASGNVGKNAAKMAYHDGKLYVACMGGNQSPGTFGDFWEVDTAAMTAKRALDTKTISALSGEPDVLPYGISIAGDGTAFLLCLTYAEDYTASVKLFVTDVTRLSAGDAGTAVDLGGSGYSWDIQYDDNAGVLWCVAGSDLQARDKTGALIKTFTSGELGNNIGTIAVLADTGAGKPGLFYTAVAGDYSGGSFGIVTKEGANTFNVSPKSSNYSSDIQGYAFKDHNGAGRVLMREYPYSAPDTLYIWSTANWSQPVLNVNGRSTNIHDAVANGQYLYLAAYTRTVNGTPDQRGEFIRLDMANGYARDKSYLLDYASEKQNIAAVSPALPAGAPTNVEIIPSDSISIDLTVSADFVKSTDFVLSDLSVMNDGAAASLSSAVARDFAEALLLNGDLDAPGIDSVTALPIFKAATSEAGKVAAIGFTVTGETLAAASAADVKVMKVLGKTASPVLFEYKSAPTGYADGTFTVLQAGAPVTALVPADSYTLVLFVKDDGPYDLDDTDQAILDPAVIVKTESDNGTGGSGSGCDMGGASVLALLAAAALRRRVKRCGAKK